MTFANLARVPQYRQHLIDVGVIDIIGLITREHVLDAER
jgi:hypothetical protein